jgi:hypothetical protein
MKILHRLVILCFAAGFASGFANAAAAEAPHPSLYSFSDLYRLTVSGTTPAPSGLPPLNAEPHQVRVASVQAPAASEVRFSVTPVPGPGRWMLLLAGLAAAAWVAHRRLTRPL